MENTTPDSRQTTGVATEQEWSPLQRKMLAAWPMDRLRALGPSQRTRLSVWIERDRIKEGEDYLTVPVLQGMLEMLETYYPEESSRVLPI